MTKQKSRRGLTAEELVCTPIGEVVRIIRKASPSERKQYAEMIKAYSQARMEEIEQERARVGSPRYEVEKTLREFDQLLEGSSEELKQRIGNLDADQFRIFLAGANFAKSHLDPILRKLAQEMIANDKIIKSLERKSQSKLKQRGDYRADIPKAALEHAIEATPRKASGRFNYSAIGRKLKKPRDSKTTRSHMKRWGLDEG